MFAYVFRCGLKDRAAVILSKVATCTDLTFRKIVFKALTLGALIY